MASHDRLTLRNVYLYLVCLITLVIAIFATVSVVRSVVELLYPDPGYYGVEVSKTPGLSEAEQKRQEALARDSQRRQSVLGLVGSGTLLVLASPLYVYHWRRIQTERPSRPTEQPTAEP
jgi:hypothetical protein